MNLEVAELRALRQVNEGEVTVAHGGYVHHGRPITGELFHALVRLHTAGYLTIGAPGPSRHRPVQTTPAGMARLAELGSRPG